MLRFSMMTMAENIWFRWNEIIESITIRSTASNVQSILSQKSDYYRKLPRLFGEGRTSNWLKDRTCTSYSGNIICSAPKAARLIRIKKLLRDQPLYSVNMKDSLKRS